MNDTIQKFGYPNTLIKEYNNWVILLRNEQITLGSLILANKDDITSLSQISKEGLEELKLVFSQIETILKRVYGMEKINYLALMMVDKHVHYHVIPRYSKEISINGIVMRDIGWPGLPDFSNVNKIDNITFGIIKNKLITNFSQI